LKGTAALEEEVVDYYPSIEYSIKYKHKKAKRGMKRGREWDRAKRGKEGRERKGPSSN